MTHHHPTNSTTNNQHAMYFNCNFCGGKIEGEEAWIGLESECPYCNKKITVPAPEAIQLPPGPPPKGGDSSKAMPPVVPVGGQHGVAPAPLDFGALASKGGDLASKGFSVINRGLDDVAGKLPIPIHYRPKWIIVGVMSLLLLIAVIAAINTNRRHHRRDRGSVSRTQRFEKQKATQGAYDLYMKGYNDPEQAEIAEAVIGGGSSDGERKCLMLIKLGAEDRRNGMSVRFELVR